MLALPVQATIYHSDAKGAWTSPSTWNGGLVPPTSLSATNSVPIDHAVTIGSDPILNPGGRLTIGAVGSLDLTGFSLINQRNCGGYALQLKQGSRIEFTKLLVD